MADRGAPSLGARGIMSRLQGQPSVPITIGLTTLLAAFLLGVAPRLLESVAAEDLRATVSVPHPGLRNIRVERQTELTPGPDEDPLSTARNVGATFAGTEFPDSVASVISDSYVLMDWPRLALEALPGEAPPHPFDMYLRFRFQEGLEEHSRLIAGSRPRFREPVAMLIGADCPQDPVERQEVLEGLSAGEVTFDENVDCAVDEVPVVEAVFTQETLDTLGLEVGSEMMMTPDTRDPLYFGVPGDRLDFRIVLSISGVLELTDPDLEYWFADTTLHRPFIEETADFRIIFAAAVPGPEAVSYLNTLTQPTPQFYLWRHFVDPDLVTEVEVDRLRNDLRLLTLEHSPATSLLGDYRFTTSLDLLIAQHQAQRAETVAMLSLAMSGLFAVVLATVVLLAALMTASQRRSIVLARNRGASGGQLLITRVYEALLLVIPPAVLGYYLAKFAVPGGDSDLFSYRAVVAIAAGIAIVLILAVIGLATRRLGSLQSDSWRSPDRSGRRLVFEALVVIAAIGAILVLRRRGQADTASEMAEFDALLAVTPVLVGVAASVLLLRLFPIAARTGSKLAALGRGAVAFVGLRRVQARSAPENLPLAVVLICLTVATVASITVSSLADGQEIASWQTIGADFTVVGFRDGVNLPPGIDVEALPVEAAVMGKAFAGARVDWEMGASRVEVLAIETGPYESLSNGSPLEMDLPDEMTANLAAGAPLPAIVSDDWPSTERPGSGDVLSVGLGIGGLQPDVVVVETRNSFPGIPAGQPFIIVDLDHLESVSDLPLTPTIAHLRAAESNGGTIGTIVTGQSATARVISRYDLVDELRQDPFIAWARLTLEVTFWIAVAFGVIASVSALALTTPSRRRDLGYLRTLGLDNGQAARSTFIEQIPAVMLGTLAGAATGIVTTLLLEPSIVLTGFTGATIPVGLEVDWSAVALMVASLIIAQSAAIGIFMLVSRRQELSRLLRVGDER